MSSKILPNNLKNKSFICSIGSDDGTLRTWSIESGQQIRMYDGLGKMSRARFCCNDNCIVVDTTQKLAIRSAKTGK